MATKVTPFVEDFEELKPTTAPAASVPPPATTTSTPTQVQGPAAPAPAPQAPTVSASAANVDDVEDVPTGHHHAAKQSSNSDDFSVEFGDEKLMSKSDGLDILRPEKGKTVRFALLTEYMPAKRAFVHYIDKKGTYHCLDYEKNSQVCCTKQQNSQPQIVALVLHYANANPKSGRYEKDAKGALPPIEWEIKFVRLSRSGFRRVSALVEEDGKPTDIDITICHKDSGIGYEYNKISVARWKKNPQLVAEIEAAVKQFTADGGKKLLTKLGKKISLLEWKALLAGTTQSDEADLSAVDDI